MQAAVQAEMSPLPTQEEGDLCSRNITPLFNKILGGLTSSHMRIKRKSAAKLEGATLNFSAC